MRFVKKHIFFLLLIVVTAGIATQWFYPYDFLYYYWDQAILIYPNFFDFVDHFFLFHDSLVVPGFVNPAALSWVYYHILASLSQQFFGLYLGQCVFVLINLLLGACGIYLLFYHLHRYLNLPVAMRGVTIFFCSFFYLFNLFAALYLYADFSPYMLFFMLLPYTILFYLKSLGNHVYLIGFAFAVIFQSQTFSQPAFLLCMVFYFFLFSMFLLEKNNILFVGRHLFLCIGIMIVLLLYYFIPLMMSGKELMDTSVAHVGGQDFVDSYRGITSPFDVLSYGHFNVLMDPLMHEWGNWVRFYEKNLLLKSFFVVYFCFIIFLNSYALRKEIRLIYLSNVVILVLALGIVSAPMLLEYPLKRAITLIPSLVVLRGWTQKMGHFYLYMLIFISFTTFHATKRRLAKILQFGLFIIIFGACAYPAVMGLFFFNKNSNLKHSFMPGVTSRLKLQQEYLELRNYFHVGDAAKILVFPRGYILDADYFKDGTGYAGANIFGAVSNRPISVSYAGSPLFVNNLIDDTIGVGINDQLLRNIKNYGFTHILVKKRYNKHPYFYPPKQLDNEQLLTFLNKKTSLVTSNDYYDLFTTGIRGFDITGLKLNYQRINPTKYRVLLRNLNDLRLLTLNKLNRSSWKLYLRPISDASWSQEIERDASFDLVKCRPRFSFFSLEDMMPLFEVPFAVESKVDMGEYPNVWVINPEQIKQNFPDTYYTKNEDGSINVEMVVFFQLQSYQYLGLFLSGIGFAGIIFYSIYGIPLLNKDKKAKGNQSIQALRENG